MTDQLEHDLRLLLTEDAAQAPSATRLSSEAQRWPRQRRRTRTAYGIGGGLAVLTVAVVGVGLADDPARDDTHARPTTSADDTSPPSDQGALPDNRSSRCLEQYSPSAVVHRAFAFDGTVTDIGPGTTDRPGAELGLASVTFAVHTWYRGGSEERMTLDLTPPTTFTGEETPTYEVGTRLLVSGEPRWGGPDLTDPIAWGCGFTRYYDKATAGEWRAASGD